MSDNNHNESPRVTVSNYTDIWNLDMVIYALEGRKLPFPANIRVLGIFVASEIFWVIAGKVFFFLPGAYIYVLLPILTTWFIAKQKLDGKAPHKWLLSMIYFAFRNKRLSRYQKVEHLHRYRYDSKITFRTKRERV